MGLDSSGRDVLVLIIYALRTSLNFGFLLVCSTMVIGSFSAHSRVTTEAKRISLATANRNLGITSLHHILILIGSVYGRSFVILLFLYGLFNWDRYLLLYARRVSQVAETAFVESAHCMGLSTFKVVFKHILPNGLVPIITFFPFSLVGAIGVLAALTISDLAFRLQLPVGESFFLKPRNSATPGGLSSIRPPRFSSSSSSVYLSAKALGVHLIHVLTVKSSSPHGLDPSLLELLNQWGGSQNE